MVRSSRKVPSMPSTAISSTGFTSFDGLTFDRPDLANKHDRNQEIAAVVLNLVQGELLLAKEPYACFANSSDTVTSFFELLEKLKDRRGKSRHGVFFGNLSTESESNVPVETFVAVKPYDKRVIDFGMKTGDAIAYELAIYEHLERLSSGSSYTPLGLWRDCDTFRVPRILTHFNEKSTSLDNYLKKPNSDRLEKMLKLGHFGLGILHGARIVHGDAFPQNFAVNGNRIILNDVTTLRPTPEHSKIAETALLKDMQAFTEGVTDLKDVSDEVRSIVLTMLLNDKFLDKLYASYSTGVQVARQRVNDSDSVPKRIINFDEHRKSVLRHANLQATRSDTNVTRT